MSFKALPLVFINLGGEMMNILDQRLTAQSIEIDKAEKVICDIVGTMLSTDFIAELFKPQELYSPKAMKSVFEKLVHSSIMKLNTSSMDKLYDLMTMVFKYQVWMCPTPYDLIFVTLNHLDTIRKYVVSSPVTTYLVDATHTRLIKYYGSLTTGEMHLIRCTILNFFLDLRIRVSVLLKDGSQNTNGSFVIPIKGTCVPHGTEIPGTITEFGADGSIVRTTSFETGAEYELPKAMGSLEPLGNRGTTLGCNIYATNRQIPNPVVNEVTNAYDSQTNTNSIPEQADVIPAVPPLDSRAHQELTLLANLIGLSGQSKPQFTLNLFSPDQDNQGDKSNKAEKERVVEYHTTTTLNIDARTNPQNDELNKIMSDMKFENLEVENKMIEDRQELLDLMDSTM